jgi:DNA-binding phage protein
MNTLKSVAHSLSEGRKVLKNVELAQKTGLTRQSIARALSGQHNFSVTTLLAIVEANGQEVLIVPCQTAQILKGSTQSHASSVASLIDGLKDL